MESFKPSTLPSRCIPYSFNEIEMEPFRIAQIMQLSRAVALDSIQPAIEAMDSVLNVDVNELTDGDFYYLLAYQRLNAYSNSPLLAQWECGGTVFQEQDGLKRTFTSEQLRALVDEYDNASEEDREHLTNPDDLTVTSIPCKHQNRVEIKLDHLTTVFLEQEKLPDGLDFPRISTLVDTQVRSKDPAEERVAHAARWIQPGNTLEEKIDILHNQPTLALFEKALQANATVVHGVSQIIVLPCEHCGQMSEHIFNISPKTFFDV